MYSKQRLHLYLLTDRRNIQSIGQMVPGVRLSAHCGAQNVSRRDLRDPEPFGKSASLGSLTRTRSAEQYQMHRTVDQFEVRCHSPEAFSTRPPRDGC